MKLYFESKFPLLEGISYETFLIKASGIFFIFLNFRRSFLVSILVSETFYCILNKNSHIWCGLFYKTFWFEASLYMFLIFWNFRGSFLSLIFVFWKFWNCILNYKSSFWGVCLIFFFNLDFWFLKISKL